MLWHTWVWGVTAACRASLPSISWNLEVYYANSLHNCQNTHLMISYWAVFIGSVCLQALNSTWIWRVLWIVNESAKTRAWLQLWWFEDIREAKHSWGKKSPWSYWSPLSNNSPTQVISVVAIKYIICTQNLDSAYLEIKLRSSGVDRDCDLATQEQVNGSVAGVFFLRHDII